MELRDYYDNVNLYINGKMKPEEASMLEHNDSFMRSVMLTGKNAKFFNKCSKDIKNDPEFLKQLIDIYKDNHEFIASIVDEFSKNNPRKYKYITELNMLLDIIYEETEDEVLHPAFEYAEDFFVTVKKKIDKEIKKIKDDNEKTEAGYGFDCIKDNYSDSEIVVNWFAKRFTYEIFLNQPSEAEFPDIIHYFYDSKDAILRAGERKSLFEVVSYFDEELSNYLYLHPKLLDPYMDLLKETLDDWDNYLENININKIEQAYQEMDRYIVENNCPSHCAELFRGIVDLSEQRDKIVKYLDDDDDYERVNVSKLTVPELRFVNHMIDFLDDIFYIDNEYEDMLDVSDYEEAPVEDSKVLKIDFVNKKKIEE